MPDSRPIGVFDSGVGGLTVLHALHRRLPRESTIYLGDLSRCPYGTRAQSEVRRFAIQIADYLADLDIKLLVVACNTATAAAFDTLATRYPFPVIGVVEPGARAAVEMSRNGVIGIVATDGTVASGVYGRTIVAIAPHAVPVERAASWLVPLIERGTTSQSIVGPRLAPTLDELRRCTVDTLILGCTHFPLVADCFSALGPEVSIVDSAETTAYEVAETLIRFDMGATEGPTHRLLVTGTGEAFSQRAEAMFHSSPKIETIELMPLAPALP